jgi:hypothetical protein
LAAAAAVAHTALTEIQVDTVVDSLVAWEAAAVDLQLEVAELKLLVEQQDVATEVQLVEHSVMAVALVTITMLAAVAAGTVVDLELVKLVLVADHLILMV